VPAPSATSSSLPSESTLITSTLLEHGPRAACGLPYWRDSARILWDPGGSAESKSPPSSSDQVLFLSLYVGAFDIIIFLTKDIPLFLKLFFFLLPLQKKSIIILSFHATFVSFI